MVAFIIPLQVYSYSYVYLMQINVKAEKTCQIIPWEYIFSLLLDELWNTAVVNLICVWPCIIN